MNYIKHLTGFFDRVAKDKLLNPTHVSLYIALFQFWNCNRFKNPISISRDEVMRISKISSKATYHKCLKALHSQGYINYEPSYNPFRGSHVYLFDFASDIKPLTKAEKNSGSNFSPVDEQVLNRSQSGTETTAEQDNGQVVVPYINNTNITNNQNTANSLNLPAPEEKIESSGQDLDAAAEGKEEEKSSAKKEEESIVTSSAVGKPNITEVLFYFQSQNFPELEANKFFNYFSSIGWLVGGRTKMVDWQAAAQNWMLNVPKYKPEERTERVVNLNASNDKDYGEPL